jgi:hypothetical protein
LYDPGDENGKTQSVSEHRWMVYDIDFRTGKIRWQSELLRARPKVTRHIKNSFASETPAPTASGSTPISAASVWSRRSTSTASGSGPRN